MKYLQNFKNFNLLQEDFGKISVRTTKLKTWPLQLEDSPRWNILSQMGFSEVSKSPYVQKDTFVVEAPDGKRFHLTKAGYVRTPKSGISATFGQEDIDTMFFYLIERYFSRWLKKIGRKPSPEDQAILAEIKKIRDEEDSLFFSTPHPNLTTQQLKFLESVCKTKNGKPQTWIYNSRTGEVDVDGDVNLSNKIHHPSYRNISSLPAKNGIKFGHVKGNFDASVLNLTTMDGMGFPHTVDKNFYCSWNKIENLRGSPSEISGDFFFNENTRLKSLEGAPFHVQGDVISDYFVLTTKGTWDYMKKMKPGYWFEAKWDMNGWSEVLKEGNLDAQKMMGTLPYLSSLWFNEEFQRDPGKTVHILATLWKYLDPKVKAGIKIPPEYEDQFDLFSGFDELGLF